MTGSGCRAFLLSTAFLCAGGTAHAAKLTTLASITGSGDGSTPKAPLISVDGVLYGTASTAGAASCGAVYHFNPTTSAETILYGFKGGADGCAPSGALLSVGKMLYGTTSQGGSTGFGTVFQIDPSTGREKILHSFAGGSDGSAPEAALIEVNGVLYGTASTGGSGGAGIVFSLDPKTKTETVLYAFTGSSDGGTPVSALINVKGTLYGTTERGGASSKGTVFSINPTTGAESVLYSFAGGSDGAYPEAALTSVNGLLYGTTAGGGAVYDGTVFTVNPASGSEQVIFTFSSESTGIAPESELINISGTLYGTTAGGGGHYTGTVYSINTATNAETVIYSFDSNAGFDASNPGAAVLNVNGMLYGTGEHGGAYTAGGIYTVATSTGAESLVYSFTGANDAEANEGLTKLDGTLFAAVAQGGQHSTGEILSINPLNGQVAQLASFNGNGQYPSAAMVPVGSVLYGTTKAGGAAGLGSVYQFNPSTGAITTAYSFRGGNDGEIPYDSLVKVGGSLYGTTYNGGIYGNGTLFKFDPATGTETVLHSFAGPTDGKNLTAGLTDVGGTLYGTAPAGGLYGYGTLFSFDLKSNTLSVLYSFTGGNDGGIPSGNLLNVNGTLYGPSYYGGADSNGAIFAYNIATSTETVVHSFTGGADGDAPVAPLLRQGNILYGTASGYFGGNGVIFQIDLTSGAESVVYIFTGGAAGAQPNSSLVESNGSIYGATTSGGTAGLGTVFRFKP